MPPNARERANLAQSNLLTSPAGLLRRSRACPIQSPTPYNTPDVTDFVRRGRCASIISYCAIALARKEVVSAVVAVVACCERNLAVAVRRERKLRPQQACLTAEEHRSNGELAVPRWQLCAALARPLVTRKATEGRYMTRELALTNGRWRGREEEERSGGGAGEKLGGGREGGRGAGEKQRRREGRVCGTKTESRRGAVT